MGEQVRSLPSGLAASEAFRGGRWVDIAVCSCWRIPGSPTWDKSAYCGWLSSWGATTGGLRDMIVSFPTAFAS